MSVGKTSLTVRQAILTQSTNVSEDGRTDGRTDGQRVGVYSSSCGEKMSPVNLGNYSNITAFVA